MTTQIVKKLLNEHLFTVDRTLEDYLGFFGSEFRRDLESLTADQHWLDAGAGEAYAQREYVGSRDLKEIVPSRARATAVSFKSIRSVEIPVDVQFRYLVGRTFESIPDIEIGPVDLVTDVVGVLNYTEHIDQVLQTYLRLLKPGGKIYVFLPTLITWIEDGKSLRKTFFDWLQSIPGLEVKEITDGKNGEIKNSAFTIQKTVENPVIPGLQLEAAAHRHSLVRIFSEKSTTSNQT